MIHTPFAYELIKRDLIDPAPKTSPPLTWVRASGKWHGCGIKYERMTPPISTRAPGVKGKPLTRAALPQDRSHGSRAWPIRLARVFSATPKIMAAAAPAPDAGLSGNIGWQAGRCDRALGNVAYHAPVSRDEDGARFIAIIERDWRSGRTQGAGTWPRCMTVSPKHGRRQGFPGTALH